MTTNPEIGARQMTLSYPSHCGNPECDRGQLQPGLQVIIFNKRIYCSTECAETHMAAAKTRPGRRTAATGDKPATPRASRARAAKAAPVD